MLSHWLHGDQDFGEFSVISDKLFVARVFKIERLCLDVSQFTEVHTEADHYDAVRTDSGQFIHAAGPAAESGTPRPDLRPIWHKNPVSVVSHLRWT